MAYCTHIALQYNCIRCCLFVCFMFGFFFFLLLHEFNSIKVQNKWLQVSEKSGFSLSLYIFFFNMYNVILITINETSF